MMYRGNNQRPSSDVTIDFEGRVVCPLHGILPSEADYVPGRAVCGCLFVMMPNGLLRCEVAAFSQHCNNVDVPTTDMGQK